MTKLQKLSGWVLGVAGLATFILFHSSGSAGDFSSKSKVKVAAAASKANGDGLQKVVLSLKIVEGWHLYANPVGNEQFEPVRTEVTIRSKSPATKSKVMYPPGKTYKFAGEELRIYEGDLKINALVQRAPGDVSPLEISVKVNACNDKTCLRPSTIKLTVP